MVDLHFPEEFFKGEEIEGFFVEEMMKRAWAAQLKVLSVVDRICKRHGLRYFLHFGSLLGAVRHKGFIPWDDDLDIAMLRKDYMEFIKYAPREMPESYRIQSFYTNETHKQPNAAVINRETVWEDKAITESHYGCPFIVGLDLYPMDYVPRDPQLAKVHKNLYMAAYDLAQRYDVYKEAGEAENLLSQLEQVSGSKINREGNIVNELWKLADRVLMMFSEDESDYLVYPSGYVTCEDGAKVRKECFSNTVYLPFVGDVQLPVPAGYTEVLIKRFGKDYMTPIRCDGTHDYPFYKRQIEYLNQNGIYL